MESSTTIQRDPASLLKRISKMSIHHPDLTKLTWGINPVQITLCSFIDGSADVITFELFGLYCTMMTGNFIMLAISLSQQNYFKALLSITVILTYLTGCFLSNIIMDKFKDDRRKSYLLCLPVQIVGITHIFVIFRMTRM